MMTFIGVLAIIFLLWFMIYFTNPENMSEFMLAYSCPGFFEKMPCDEQGTWEAQAGIETMIGGYGIPRKTKVCNGKREAYITARRLALMVEKQEQHRNPMMSAYEDNSYPNSVGVYWRIEEQILPTE